MSKITAAEFEALLDEDHEPGTDDAKVAHRGENIQEGKMVYQETVYQYKDQFFGVLKSRDTRSYWDDGEHYEPEVYEMKEIEGTRMEYVAI